MITSGRYRDNTAHLNRQLRSITNGEVDSKLRPDVAAVREDGRIDIVEALSPGQKPGDLENKYRQALGKNMGDFKAVEPTKQKCVGSLIEKTSC